VADYSAAKAGIIGFTMAVAKEVAVHGININCVSPSQIENRWTTPKSSERGRQMTGMTRAGKPDDIASMVAFLVSEDASFITGANHPVGGLRVLGIQSAY
jgi:acetoacetyl-CoA reductase